ncbi:MAG: Ku protein [Candidatus Melainabacteria bacterium]|nr:MAG: Ku protein [Candidatus Melainabacteria bacterium]
MPGRALWTGIVTFGLVSIPIKLYTATESKSVSFNQIHGKCKTKIQERRWCPHCERMVEWEEIEKGFEYAKGEFIPITKEDLESIPLPSKNTIAVQSFVKISEIDPVYFEKSYYVEPEENALRPFALFLQTLIDKDMVGIGSFTIRTKERLCCLRPVGGTLLIDTLLYPDEIKVDLNAKVPAAKLSLQEKKMAASLVDMMAQPFDPENFKDHYREALEKLIEAKLEGVEIEKPTPGKAGTTDLMESLRRSLGVIEGGKKAGTAAKVSGRKVASERHVRLVKSEEKSKKGAKSKKAKSRKAG